MATAISGIQSLFSITRSAPLTVLTGPSLYDHEEAIGHLRCIFTKEWGDEGEIVTLRGDDQPLKDALASASGAGFFASARLLILRGYSPRKKDDAELLNDWTSSPPPGSYVVFSAPEVTEASPFAKGLSGNIALYYLPELKGGEFTSRAMRLISSLGLSVDPEVASSLTSAFAGDLLALKNELEKIIAYTSGRKTIRKEDLAAVSLSEAAESVYKLVDHVARKRRKEALALLERALREGEQAQSLHAVLATEVRKLLRAAEMRASGESDPDILKALNVRFYQNQFLSRVAESARWRAEEVLKATVESDRALKTSVKPPEVVLVEFVYALTE
ncbi:MAG: DNA polymerase III subunit delta [Candidatus Brocadiia bacterium]